MSRVSVPSKVFQVNDVPSFPNGRLRRAALLVQDRGCRPPEAATGHSSFVSHALKRLENCVIAHRLLCAAVAGKSHSLLPLSVCSVSSTPNAVWPEERYAESASSCAEREHSSAPPQGQIQSILRKSVHWCARR